MQRVEVMDRTDVKKESYVCGTINGGQWYCECKERAILHKDDQYKYCGGQKGKQCNFFLRKEDEPRERIRLEREKRSNRPTSTANLYTPILPTTRNYENTFDGNKLYRNREVHVGNQRSESEATAGDTYKTWNIGSTINNIDCNHEIRETHSIPNRKPSRSPTPSYTAQDFAPARPKQAPPGGKDIPGENTSQYQEHLPTIPLHFQQPTTPAFLYPTSLPSPQYHPYDRSTELWEKAKPVDLLHIHQRIQRVERQFDAIFERGTPLNEALKKSDADRDHWKILCIALTLFLLYILYNKDMR